MKISVENGNVVSTLSNVSQINVEMDKGDSTLFNVDVHNVVSTLIWRCATSRRHINLKTTLKWRWNVCWGALKRKKDKVIEVKKGIRSKMQLAAWRYLAFGAVHNKQSKFRIEDLMGKAGDMYNTTVTQFLVRQ